MIIPTRASPPLRATRRSSSDSSRMAMIRSPPALAQLIDGCDRIDLGTTQQQGLRRWFHGQAQTTDQVFSRQPMWSSACARRPISGVDRLGRKGARPVRCRYQNDIGVFTADHRGLKADPILQFHHAAARPERSSTLLRARRLNRPSLLNRPRLRSSQLHPVVVRC